MPFAGYNDFDECVRRNRGKRDAKAYCAEIMRRVEEEGNMVDEAKAQMRRKQQQHGGKK